MNNDVTAKRSELVRTWCYNHDESVKESIEPVSLKLEERSTLKVASPIGAVVLKHDEKQSLTLVMPPDDDI